MSTKAQTEIKKEENTPLEWTRNTVADGKWLNDNTIKKLRNADLALATFVDDLYDKIAGGTGEVTEEELAATSAACVQSAKTYTDNAINGLEDVYAKKDDLNTLSGNFEDLSDDFDDFLIDYDADALVWDAHSALSASKLDKSEAAETYQPKGSYVTSGADSFPDNGQYGIIKNENGIAWGVIQGGGSGGITQVNHDGTLQGDGNQSQLGVKQDAAMNLTNTSAASATWAQKAKGAHTDYVIGSELDSLTSFQQNIINWTDRIDGANGIEVLDLDEDGYPEIFKLTDTAWGAVQETVSHSAAWNGHSALSASKLDSTVAAQTYQTQTGMSNYYTKSETSGASELSDEFAKYLKTVATEKGLTGTGTSNDKVRINETGMTNGNKYGWDYQHQQWAAINEGGTGNYVEKTGDQMTGTLELSGSDNFDAYYLNMIRENQPNNNVRIGVGSSGQAVIKSKVGNYYSQLTISPNTSKEIPTINVQYAQQGSGDSRGLQLIPMKVHNGSYTPDSDDGILHIVVES